MNANHLLFRLPVVLLSLALLGGYVYVRAGGRLPSWPAPSPEPAVAIERQQPTGFESLPGSKSAMVFFPEEEGSRAAGASASSASANANVSAQQSMSGNASASSSDQLIYGSKSAPVFLPAESVQTQPKALLPGSKSDVLISPADINGPPGNTSQRRQR